MLEGLRAVQNTWIGKAVLALIMAFIVVSFVIWGIRDVFMGVGGNQVARVGSVDISANAYRQAYQVELQTLEQQTRRAITNEEAHRFGIDGQVLSRMVSEAVLDDRAHHLGLALSDADIAKAVVNDPAFAGPGGFDRNRFDAVLQHQGVTEQIFLREQRDVYLRQQLVRALVGDVAPPSAMVEAAHRFETETRSLETITLKPAAVEPIPAADESTLRTFYDAHKSDFNAPEYRQLVVLTLDPRAMAKPKDVSDDDARKLYDEVKDTRYGSSDQRDVQQIVFPTLEEAAAGAASLKAGKSFADLAAERKLDSKDVDLGSVTKDQIFDTAVADAAFSMPIGSTSDPIKTSFGAVLVHVEPPHVKSYEDVADGLRQEIAERRAADAIKDLQHRIEDARSSGKPLAEAAKTVGLEARTVSAISAAGLDKDGKPVDGLADRDALVKAAFASDIGVDNDTIRGKDGSVTWFEVASIEGAHVRPFDDVKPQVEAAWHRDEVAKRLEARAEDLVKAIEAGKSLDEVATSAGGLPVGHVVEIKRGGSKDLSSEAVAKIFDGPVGSVGSAPQGGDRLVFKVTGSTVPPLDANAPAAAQLKSRLGDGLAEDIITAYLNTVGAEVGIRINQDALRAAAGAGY